MEALGIDLKTLIFQLINFLLLLFILTRLLHTPLKALLESRRKEIEEGLANAEAARKQLEQAEADRKALLEKADQEGRVLISAAKKRAGDLESELSADAQQKAERMVAKTREELAAERDRMKDELRGELAELVVTATEKVLSSPIPEKEKRENVAKLVNEVKP
jgi:F-type H+-transporting ATPase subunit b